MRQVVMGIVIRLKSSTSSNFTVSSFSEFSDFPELLDVNLSRTECFKGDSILFITGFESMFWCVTLSPTFFMFEFIILFRVFELTFFGILGQPSALSSKLIFPWLDKDPLLGVSSSRQLSVSARREGRVACLGRSAGLSHLVRGIVTHDTQLSHTCTVWSMNT